MNNLDILRVRDLMEYFHFGKDKAYNLMRTPSFPSMQIGKTYFVTMDNLQLWLKDNAGKNIEV